jgi:hypothetical protein
VAPAARSVQQGRPAATAPAHVRPERLTVEQAAALM